MSIQHSGKGDSGSRVVFVVDTTTGRLDGQELLIGVNLARVIGGLWESPRAARRAQAAWRIGLRLLSVARVRQRALLGSSSWRSYAVQDSDVRCGSVTAAAATRR
jgi:hypothetical protein